MPVDWGSSALLGDVLPIHVPVSQIPLKDQGSRTVAFSSHLNRTLLLLSYYFSTVCPCIRSSSWLSIGERFILPGPPSFPDPCKRDSLFLLPLLLFSPGLPQEPALGLSTTLTESRDILQNFSPHRLLFVSKVACSYHRPCGPTALEMRQIYLPLRTEGTSVNMLIEAWNCLIYWCAKVLSGNVPPLSLSTRSGPPWLKIFWQCVRLYTQRRVEKRTVYVSLPYFGPLTHDLGKQLNAVLSPCYPQINFKFCFKNNCRISSFFKFKDSLPAELCANIICKKIIVFFFFHFENGTHFTNSVQSSERNVPLVSGIVFEKKKFFFKRCFLFLKKTFFSRFFFLVFFPKISF